MARHVRRTFVKTAPISPFRLASRGASFLHVFMPLQQGPEERSMTQSAC